MDSDTIKIIAITVVVMIIYINIVVAFSERVFHGTSWILSCLATGLLMTILFPNHFGDLIYQYWAKKRHGYWQT